MTALHGQLIVSMESPLLLPGVSLGGDHVSYVETHVDSKVVRSTAWLVTATSSDRMRDPFVSMTASAMPDVDYPGAYRCKVTAQNGTRCDLLADDQRMPTLGFKNVPLLVGIPGVSVTFAPGAFVRPQPPGGDPRLPYCSLWEGGETLSAASIGSAADGVVTKQDFAALIAALTAATAAGGGATLLFPTPLPTLYASNTVKVQR